ncbi:Hypothetical predicted protein [Prunus dulcis]|uniref:UspA domain-containing protein n=1 Tax=Prunus dulcis TaxID=3755 RepID=A0A5E4FHM4_PRUDU|nr:uncharacterized protein LOC117627162 [Prunus dulcis]KAI5330282.1 hypothetical protein L3X38_029680 [Prunus dulcis]VVA27664.1 Hypothetical predicted protein [Prunus dulcis]
MVPPSSSGGRLILCIYMYVQPASFATKTNIVNKMSRKYARLCGARPTLCLPIHSLSLRSKHTSRRCSGSIKTDHNSTEFLNNISSSKDDFSADSLKRGSSEVGNKIMVVVDPSLEAKGALEWALSHTVQTQDTIVLVHVAKPSKQGAESDGKINLRAFELLHSMKNVCQRRRPEVEVEVALLEGKEKGPIIVEEAKRQRVSLLVLGQKRKRSMWWQLIKRWTRTRSSGEVTVEYCIQNAACMTIAVRRKSKKLGGYLITTKLHKNFWLLA